jgi:hypothetical protein
MKTVLTTEVFFIAILSRLVYCKESESCSAFGLKQLEAIHCVSGQEFLQEFV